jgi:2-polyprenyl-3-methyl-5-hydroxy-6-metoxy-1,4-benzoquinol methylase
MTATPCPVCNATTTVWFELERGRIRRCSSRSCGIGFLEQQPDDEELSSLYRQYYYPGHCGEAAFVNSTVLKSKQHLSALDDRFGLTSSSVLDYGCGEGVFLGVAREHGVSVAGVEFDDVGRATATARGFHVEKSIDSFESGSIDFVYMNDVIEHLRDPVSDLAAIRSRLTANGAIFVVTMNMRGLSPRLRGAKWDVVTNPTHFWFYDERSLAETLRRAGFDRTEVQRWPVRFDHHGLIRGLTQRLLQSTGLDASLRMIAWSTET